MGSLFFFFYVFVGLGLGYGFVYLFYVGGFVVEFQLLSLGSVDVGFMLVFDFLSVGFFGCVSLISCLVFLYSNFYMSGGLDLRRFFYLVFMFVVSMFFLVFSGSFFLTMLGWDGLGLVSFCLVIFYSNSVSLDSGLVTVFSNRVGDVFFLMCFFFFSLTGWWSFDCYSLSDLGIFGFLIVVGAITKSAQVPFSAWLPAAMAAPTPVSSLVHSSTLVTAGLYVLIRYHYVFVTGFWILKVFGISTMFLAGMCACVEKDFKKIIAMSTLSQLGMMVYVLSIGLWGLSFLHMMIHAFFKSMLFLSSGSLISQSGGGQDSRFYGSERWMGGSYLYFLVSCLGLSGFPFVIGFYSKDSMLSGLSGFYGGVFYFLFLLSCGLTIMYSMRLVYMGYVVGSKNFVSKVSDENLFFVLPVYFLFFICCFSGSFLSWFFLSELSVIFRGFDYSLGLFLILMFFCLFLWGNPVIVFSHFLGNISFLVWISTGGVSSLMKGVFLHRGEGSWLELVGAQGVYGGLGLMGGFFFRFLLLGLKGLGMFMLSGLIFLY